MPHLQCLGCRNSLAHGRLRLLCPCFYPAFSLDVSSCHPISVRVCVKSPFSLTGASRTGFRAHTQSQLDDICEDPRLHPGCWRSGDGQVFGETQFNTLLAGPTQKLPGRPHPEEPLPSVCCPGSCAPGIISPLPTKLVSAFPSAPSTLSCFLHGP